MNIKDVGNLIRRIQRYKNAHDYKYATTVDLTIAEIRETVKKLKTTSRFNPSNISKSSKVGKLHNKLSKEHDKAKKSVADMARKEFLRDKINKSQLKLKPSQNLKTLEKQAKRVDKFNRAVKDLMKDLSNYNKKQLNSSTKLNLFPENLKELKESRKILQDVKNKGVNKFKQENSIPKSTSLHRWSKGKQNNKNGYRDFIYLNTIIRDSGSFSYLFERGGLSMMSDFNKIGLTIMNFSNSDKNMHLDDDVIIEAIKVRFNEFSVENKAILLEFMHKYEGK